MKKPIIIIFILSFTLAALFLSGCTDRHRTESEKAKSVTLISLLDEMTERESLTRFPEFRLKQVSSWDRTQTGPDDPSTWFNNKDHSHYIRMEENEGRTEYVIMEEFNPGCIVRWWIPLEDTYKNRIVRIYLDGNEIPVIEENYHDLMSGKGFVKPPFAFVSSDEENSMYQLGLPVGHPKQMGAGLYLPIPFAKSCKITLDDNPFYYVINYRVYDPGTKMETFSMQQFKAAEKAIKKASDKLSFNATQTLKETNQQIPPGKDMVFNLPAGPNAVKNILLKLDPATSKNALRSIVLQADFDSKETIWCPVTEFFSGGVYVRPVENQNSSVTRNGLFQSKWVMPYKKSGNIKISNYGDTPLFFDIKIETESYAWNPNSLYFHANWHEEAPINTTSPKDWNYIEIEGKGVYAGDVLTVHSFSKGWWGEGDEKIYVDDEKEFPAMLGTGLEDYYGFAWGMPHHFNSAFISTTLRDAQGKGDWSGYTTVARMRLLDGIPFDVYLRVDVEAWLHDSSTSYAVATFWYGTPESKCNIKKDVNALKRNLPDFKREESVVWPGEKYPDPALDGLTKPLGNGLIKHAGNHIDLLDWQDKNTAKPMDADNDNKYGTAGYQFFAGKILDRRNISFSEDSYLKLPAFIDSIELTGAEYYAIQDTWLTIPGHPDLFLITGGLKANHTSYQADEVLRFK
ncbi:MAG: DUF2961 domain-containing protein, partial [Bacteroidales bacterium]|nr:DUF2961 domain-containing protein [Bacteroidales bacterium]